MKRTMKRKLGTTLLVGYPTLGVAACDKASAVGYSNNFVSHEGIQGEFVKAHKSLNWPEGYEMLKEIDYKKDGSSYEKGLGVTRASLHWETAWEREWLNNYKIDPGRAEKALAKLEKATEMTYMSLAKCDDAIREALAKYLDQARHGDPSGFGENIKLNAPE